MFWYPCLYIIYIYIDKYHHHTPHYHFGKFVCVFVPNIMEIFNKMSILLKPSGIAQYHFLAIVDIIVSSKYDVHVVMCTFESLLSLYFLVEKVTKKADK